MSGSSQSTPKQPTPLSVEDYIAFRDAVIDDLSRAHGYPAIQSWISNLSEGKSGAGSAWFSKWADYIDTLRREIDGD